MNWKKDKKWSDRFITEIKAALGVHLIQEAPIEEDQERNTDLMVFSLGAIRVGCRIRRWGYLLKYPLDITIRSGRPSGQKTELAKILEGWGDYFFYGFSNEYEVNLAAWRILNVDGIRHYLQQRNISTIDNHDGSSEFIPIDSSVIQKQWKVATYIADDSREAVRTAVESCLQKRKQSSR